MDHTDTDPKERVGGLSTARHEAEGVDVKQHGEMFAPLTHTVELARMASLRCRAMQRGGGAVGMEKRIPSRVSAGRRHRMDAASSEEWAEVA
jgi:hypothetical protein